MLETVLLFFFAFCSLVILFLWLLIRIGKRAPHFEEHTTATSGEPEEDNEDSQGDGLMLFDDPMFPEDPEPEDED